MALFQKPDPPEPPTLIVERGEMRTITVTDATWEDYRSVIANDKASLVSVSTPTTTAAWRPETVTAYHWTGTPPEEAENAG